VVRGIAEIASRITRAIAVPGFSLGESIRASSAARRDLAAKTGEGASGFAARVGDFTGDRGRERLREIEREGVVPVARAVEARADDALGIDEPRLGKSLVPYLPLTTLSPSGSMRTVKSLVDPMTDVSVARASSALSSVVIVTSSTLPA